MSPRSVGARTAEVSEAAANAAPLILGWLKGPLDEHLLANDVEAKFADGKNQVAEYQRQNPDKGVLLAVEIRQHPGTRNWGVERPRPQAVSVIPTYGYTSANEARAAYEAQPSISDANMEQLPPAYQWLPPLRATPNRRPATSAISNFAMRSSPLHSASRRAPLAPLCQRRRQTPRFIAHAGRARSRRP
jgi:hypothetical protein